MQEIIKRVSDRAATALLGELPQTEALEAAETRVRTAIADEFDTIFTQLGTDPHYGDVFTAAEGFAAAHEGEPLFCIRGRDELAPAAIDFYAELANSNQCDPSVMARIVNAEGKFREWQSQNGDEVHRPD